MSLNTLGTASDIQYSATGGSDDWARGVAGIKWVIKRFSDKSLIFVFQVGLSDRAARQGKGLPATTKVRKKIYAQWSHMYPLLNSIHTCVKWSVCIILKTV